MKITLQVDSFKSLLANLGGVANPKAVLPSYRYIAVKADKNFVSFLACNGEILARKTVPAPEVRLDGLKGESDVMMIDSVLFSALVNTFNPSSEITLIKNEDTKSIGVICGQHRSEQQFNFDVRFEDFKSEKDMGGPLPPDPAAASDWKEVYLDVVPWSRCIKLVDFCLPNSDLHTGNQYLSGLRVSIKDADPNGSNPDGGSWVQMNTTNRFQFTNFKFRSKSKLPALELLIDYTIVAQMQRLGFTHLYFNGRFYGFRGGDSGVIMHARAISSPDLFPDTKQVFGMFEDRKKLSSVKLETSTMIPVLTRQCLFADSMEAKLISTVRFEEGVDALKINSDNRISRGDDEIPFTRISDKIEQISIRLDPQEILSYANICGHRFLNMLVAKRDKKLKDKPLFYVAFCPDVIEEARSIEEESRKKQEAKAAKEAEKKSKESSKVEPEGNTSIALTPLTTDGEDSKSPLMQLDSAEFIYVVGGISS